MSDAEQTRIVHDTMGALEIPADAPWGAQTQRSLLNFPIGREKMPWEQIRAMLQIKRAAAVANRQLGRLDARRCEAICRSCDRLLEAADLSAFPLSVWQTGSGTQSNMNVNEVIAECCHRNFGTADVHPNDHVNMSQSSNDVFPSGMHMAARRLICERVIPATEALVAELLSLELHAGEVIKIGRTHLQDAVPLSFAQEVSGWRAALQQDLELLREAAAHLAVLPLGGTAVGTGLNAPVGYKEAVAAELSRLTGRNYHPADNFFSQMAGKNYIVHAHGVLRVLATDLFKISNDIRLLASGPRCGLGELELPANEPGSSIMPGKVNPTQCEALSMLCVQVMGNDVAVAFGGGSGHLQLNTFMPLMISNFVQSAELLADGCHSFAERCVAGIVIKDEQMRRNVELSLMLVTRLAPEIGYEACAKIAKTAFAADSTLRAVAVGGGYLSEERYDELMQVADMLHPQKI